MQIHVVVWNENRHEESDPVVAGLYPQGIHGTLSESLSKDKDITVGTATLDEPEHGLTSEVLEKTDVLIWWSHIANHQVDDTIAAKVYNRVMEGMGLIVLHSAFNSKVFKQLMGTTCTIRDWREAGEKERIWVVEPSHPIAEGLGDYFDVEAEEMYSESFDIPVPQSVVFIGSFEKGEVFRSGCCFTRGRGRVFYFQPGHETYPVYHNPFVQRAILNAVKWAAPNFIETK